LEAVGLRGAHHLMTSQLSGGMSRRVALARAIMLDPELMMYDEPFTGQDPINRGVLIKLIRELNTTMGITSIVVSHDVHEVSLVADYVYVLANGQIIGQGSPSEIIAGTTPQLQQFIQGLADGPVPFKYPAADYREELEL
jgi:phospholipid/cholesterol/gamma-HCH transport system ATP-binding protein